jgi:hypothetical protein
MTSGCSIKTAPLRLSELRTAPAAACGRSAHLWVNWSPRPSNDRGGSSVLHQEAGLRPTGTFGTAPPPPDSTCPIPEGMLVALMPVIARGRVPGEEPAHGRGQGLAARAHPQVHVSGQERPAEHLEPPPPTASRRASKSCRFAVVSKRRRRSISRTLTACNVPGASRRPRGIEEPSP